MSSKSKILRAMKKASDTNGTKKDKNPFDLSNFRDHKSLPEPPEEMVRGLLAGHFQGVQYDPKRGWVALMLRRIPVPPGGKSRGWSGKMVTVDELHSLLADLDTEANETENETESQSYSDEKPDTPTLPKVFNKKEGKPEGMRSLIEMFMANNFKEYSAADKWRKRSPSTGTYWTRKYTSDSGKAICAKVDLLSEGPKVVTGVVDYAES